MASTKSRGPYPGCERGGVYGYLGAGTGISDSDWFQLAHEAINWIQQDRNVYLKTFFATRGILWRTVQKCASTREWLRDAIDLALEIQEGKLARDPLYRDLGVDGAHARFILSRHHRGEYSDPTQTSHSSELSDSISCLRAVLQQRKEPAVVQYPHIIDKDLAECEEC